MSNSNSLRSLAGQLAQLPDAGEGGALEASLGQLVRADLDAVSQGYPWTAGEQDCLVGRAMRRLLSALRCNPELSVPECETELLHSVKREFMMHAAMRSMSHLRRWVSTRLPTALRNDADDVIQDLLHVIDRRCDHYEWRSESQFLALLRRIAERQIWDRIKGQVRRKNMEHQDPGQVEREPAGRDGTPSVQIWRAERASLVKEVMERELNVAEQEIVRLRFIEQRSVAETAALLEKSEGAIKMATQRLLLKLRQKLRSSLADTSLP